jgi:octaprenyl-diphosphate synthase
MKVAFPVGGAPLPTMPDVSTAGQEIMERLEQLCLGSGLQALAGRLAELGALVGDDLADLEAAFELIPHRPERVNLAAHHLLTAGGKRLRPLCVILAARAGSGYGAEVRDLAVAIELVHNATLLHDDVVDLGESRRGSATARKIYGNAASIFAGDWLLIEALRRVTDTGRIGLLRALYDTIEEMIYAESLQLENRGRLDLTRSDYLRVSEGKTASVFRWAMRAGGEVGGLSSLQVGALESFGNDLGVAFQAIDDVLDLAGDAETTGKDLFTDLREGKMTLPVILGLERSSLLAEHLREALAADAEAPVDAAVWRAVAAELAATGAVDTTVSIARERSAQAIGRLAVLPHGPARRALETVAEGLVTRSF